MAAGSGSEAEVPKCCVMRIASPRDTANSEKQLLTANQDF